MTPKEKAIQLVNSFYPILGGIEPRDWEYFCHDKAKKCALIAVNEIGTTLIQGHETELVMMPISLISYWQEVKTEIEKL